MSRRKDNADLGSSALKFSRFDLDFNAFEQKVKEEAERQIQEAKLKKLAQKKKFDELSLKYKDVYTDTIMEYAPEILEKLGLKIKSELVDIVNDAEKITLLNKTGTFRSVFEKDRKNLALILKYLEEREEIRQDILAYLGKENA